MEFVSWGMPPAEFQLMLMETALRLMAAVGVFTIGAASFVYCLLWLAEARGARYASSRAPAGRRRHLRASGPPAASVETSASASLMTGCG